MSIVDIYERAHHRLEMEKEAQAIVDYYGTSDGYLPEAYFGAYMQMEKEAHEEYLIDTFAPETGYIPAAYVSVLEKEANIIADLGKGLIRSGAKAGQKAGATAQASDIATRTGMKFKAAPDATFGQQLKTHGANLMQRTGQFMANNPNTAAAIGVGGVGAAGYGLTR